MDTESELCDFQVLPSATVFCRASAVLKLYQPLLSLYQLLVGKDREEVAKTQQKLVELAAEARQNKKGKAEVDDLKKKIRGSVEYSGTGGPMAGPIFKNIESEVDTSSDSVESRLSVTD